MPAEFVMWPAGRSFKPWARSLTSVWLAGLLTATAGADPGPGASRVGLSLPALPPFAASPRPWPTSMLGTQSGRWYLPPAVIGRQPRPAETAQQQALRLRPTPDRPGVAGPAGPLLVTPYLVPSGPLAYAASPEVVRWTPPWRAATPDPGRPDATSDPAQELAYRRLLMAQPPWRQKPAAFLRLTIPDPLETVTEIRLAKPSPDADGPARDDGLPPKPTLPVQAGEQK